MSEIDHICHRRNLSHTLPDGETVTVQRVYERAKKGVDVIEKRRENGLTRKRLFTSFPSPNKTRIMATLHSRRRHHVVDRYLFAGNVLQWLTSTAFQR
jgi:hypothetical protein